MSALLDQGSIALKQADALRLSIAERLKIRPESFPCSRASVVHGLCVKRDGALAVVFDRNNIGACSGCCRFVSGLWAHEQIMNAGGRYAR